MISSTAPVNPQNPEALRRQIQGEVLDLTQKLVQVDSGPDNLVPGEVQTIDMLQAYATSSGLAVGRGQTVHGKPMLTVTLPGSDPNLGAVGFVHHSDVVGALGDWTLGEPYSGKLTTDEHGRQVLVGRGSIDTKGPAAQILGAMKYYKQMGTPLARTMKLFVFPDEETGGVDGAWLESRTQPEKFKDVQYWVVEGSGILSKEMLANDGITHDAPYLAVAQKYTLPVQLQLKTATDPDEAMSKTQDALHHLDTYIEKKPWTHLGSENESREAYQRMGHLLGGIKGWALRHFWKCRFIENRTGPTIAAANRTDFCKTDFYFSTNPNGTVQGPNVKPSTATAVVEIALTGKDRDRALQKMQKWAGPDVVVTPLEDPNNGKDTLQVRLTLPKEHYQSDNHGSTPDRQHDAVDVTDRALEKIQKEFHCHGWADKIHVVDFFTGKSDHPVGGAPTGPVASRVTLDLRVAVDADRHQILQEMQDVVGPDFELKPLSGQNEFDADVRRLSYKSPLFQAAEAAIHQTYGADTPIIFGNTTASNDVRYLMDANPQSEALAFVPVLYTEHGAHAPDECVTVDSLQKGVDWCIGLMHEIDHQP